MKNPFNLLSTQFKSFVAVLSLSVIVITLSIGAISYCKRPKEVVVTQDSVKVLANEDYYSATQVLIINGKAEVSSCSPVHYHLYVTPDTVILKNLGNSSSQPILGKPLKFVNNGATLVVQGLAGNYFTLTLGRTKEDVNNHVDFFMILRTADEYFIVLSPISSCQHAKDIISKQLAPN